MSMFCVNIGTSHIDEASFMVFNCFLIPGIFNPNIIKNNKKTTKSSLLNHITNHVKIVENLNMSVLYLFKMQSHGRFKFMSQHYFMKCLKVTCLLSSFYLVSSFFDSIEVKNRTLKFVC